MPNKIRIDKWLWAVRLFKTRSSATDACRAGKVRIDGKSLKPSHMLEQGATLEVRKSDKLWVVRVEKLIEKRVGAGIAQECYIDLSPPTDPSENAPSFFYRTNEIRERGSGRPTKKDRREIDRLKEPD